METLNEKIKKIEVNSIDGAVEWLSKGPNHALNEPDGILRFLLRKVVDLEEKIEELTKAQP